MELTFAAMQGAKRAIEQINVKNVDTQRETMTRQRQTETQDISTKEEYIVEHYRQANQRKMAEY